MFWFFNFTRIFQKTSKVWATSCKNESNLLLVRITVCIESCLPIDWRTFIWWKNPPKCCSILVWISGCWNSLLTSCNPKNNWCLSRIFRAWGLAEKIVVWAHAKQEVGFIFAWSGSEVWTPIKYSRSKLKIKIPIAVDVLFKAYPMVPLWCRSNLAGRYAVPLIRYWHAIYLKFHTVQGDKLGFSHYNLVEDCLRFRSFGVFGESADCNFMWGRYKK